jgi:hypothetical protein
VDTDRLDPPALRRGVLAVSVLHDVPVEPAGAGVRVGRSWDDRTSWTPAGWAELAAALAGADPESEPGRLRLRDWLRARAHLAAGLDDDRLVALALPTGHALHPGGSWVVERVLGGVLHVGPGLRPDDGGTAVPLPPTAVPPGGASLDAMWPALRQHLARMAALAVERLDQDGQGVLRSFGGCDVLTLLSDPLLRSHLASGDGTGMRAVAVPMRSRGWFDLRRIDPAFVGAAATATDPEHRGVAVPLLVTADEVAARTAVDPARVARACLD